MLIIWSPRGPRVPMAWGGCIGAAGYPMGCQIGRLTRHETPLARPSQATKISKPNRFAYPFRSRPRGVYRPLWLNLPEHQTSSYRDTANLGLGVRPRGATARNLVWFGPFGPDALGHSSTFYPTRRQIRFQTPYPMQFQLPRVRLEKPWSLKTCDQNTTKTLNIIHQVLSGKYFLDRAVLRTIRLQNPREPILLVDFS